MKIAVIGAGIAGLSCAWRLARAHDVTLYEANARLGGHTNTVEVEVDGVRHPVDTGFLVFNHRTYPNLTRLFDELGVATAPSEMSFSVSLSDAAGARALEWAGTDLNSVFAQRRNLLNPRFLRMLADILRFNKQATALAGRDTVGANPVAMARSLGDFLVDNRYSDVFRDWYLLPMAAAIWSCPAQQMLAFPMATFIRFCHNHGLLQVTGRPQWYTVIGGGREYVRKLAAAIPHVRRGEPALAVARDGLHGMTAVRSSSGTAHYDQVVLACHSDQALALLADASLNERAVLGAIRYQPNHAILHTDTTLLPRNRRAWAAWNYQSRASDNGSASVCLHYLINKLQPVPFKRPVLLSLNTTEQPAPASILAEIDYAHPVFDAGAIAAQRRLPALQGLRNTWFCGAWTGYGFHEDGLRSGLEVAERIGAPVPVREHRAATGLAA